MSLKIVSQGPSGMCAELTYDGGSYICHEFLFFTKGPIYFPSNTTSRKDIIETNKKIARAVVIAQQCSEQARRLLCGDAFSPCASQDPPKESGPCSKICKSYADCLKDKKINKNFDEVCEASHWTVDNSGSPDEPILCGSSSTVTPNRGVKVLTISMLALNILASLTIFS